MKGLFERYSAVELATLVDTPPDGEEWIHEVKFDGYRLLGQISGGVARLQTRNGKDWTAKFPSLSAALKPLKDAVIDMEAVVLDAEGKSDFQSLQVALGDGGDSNKIVAYVFDLLYLDGKDLRPLPLTERKEKLKRLLKQSKWLRYSDHVAGQGAAMFQKACAAGLEGIVSKRADAPYQPGRQEAG